MVWAAILGLQAVGVVYQWLPNGYTQDGMKARYVNGIGAVYPRQATVIVRRTRANLARSCLEDRQKLSCRLWVAVGLVGRDCSPTSPPSRDAHSHGTVPAVRHHRSCSARQDSVQSLQARFCIWLAPGTAVCIQRTRIRCSGEATGASVEVYRRLKEAHGSLSSVLLYVAFFLPTSINAAWLSFMTAVAALMVPAALHAVAHFEGFAVFLIILVSLCGATHFPSTTSPISLVTHCPYRECIEGIQWSK